MNDHGHGPLRRLWRASIWHPDSVPPEEWKYRSLKRVWLPVYFALAALAGFWATFIGGSPLLRQLLHDNLIAALGGLLMIVSLTGLVAVLFPRLWRVAMLADGALVALLSAYAAAIWGRNIQGDLSSGFTSFIVCLGLPLMFFHLQLLGEELKERRAAVARDAAREGGSDVE